MTTISFNLLGRSNKNDYGGTNVRNQIYQEISGEMTFCVTSVSNLKDENGSMAEWFKMLIGKRKY